MGQSFESVPVFEESPLSVVSCLSSGDKERPITALKEHGLTGSLLQEPVSQSASSVSALAVPTAYLCSAANFYIRISSTSSRSNHCPDIGPT